MAGDGEAGQCDGPLLCTRGLSSRAEEDQTGEWRDGRFDERRVRGQHREGMEEVEGV